MRPLILTLMMFSAASALRSDSPQAKTKSCRDHPKLVGSCFKLRGRLSVYNGAPALRVWKIGSRRMFGVSEQRFVDPEIRNVPEQIQHEINQDVALFGDFTLCPFTPAKPATMQLVCIEKVENLVVRKQN